MARKDPLYLLPVTARNTISGTGSQGSLSHSAFWKCGASDWKLLMGITHLLDEMLLALRLLECVLNLPPASAHRQHASRLSHSSWLQVDWGLKDPKYMGLSRPTVSQDHLSPNISIFRGFGWGGGFQHGLRREHKLSYLLENNWGFL